MAVFKAMLEPHLAVNVLAPALLFMRLRPLLERRNDGSDNDASEERRQSDNNTAAVFVSSSTCHAGDLRTLLFAAAADGGTTKIFHPLIRYEFLS